MEGEKQPGAGGVRMEIGAGVYFMKHRHWEGLLGKVQLGEDHQGWVRKWFEAFDTTCQAAWKGSFHSSDQVAHVKVALESMGAMHSKLGWAFTLWVHLWVDHLWAYLQEHRILSTFSCFRMEGSHRVLKARLKNSMGTKVKGDRVGLQGVVDKATLCDSLYKRGYDVRKRTLRTQEAAATEAPRWKALKRLRNAEHLLQPRRKRRRAEG